MSATTLTCPSGTAPTPMSAAACRTSRASVLTTPPINRAHRAVLLPRGRGMTFAPREDTRLNLATGRLWITFEAPANGLAPRNGDHFIAAGDRIDLLAGEAAVLEAVGDEAAALFDLDPLLSLPWHAVAQQLWANVGPIAAHARDRLRRLIDLPKE